MKSIRRFLFCFLFLSSPIQGAERPLPDLILLTIPKSGTHLLLKAIKLIQEKVPEMQGKRVLSIHFLYNKRNKVLKEHLENRGIKKVVLLRDLRDVFVSAVHHLNSFSWFPGIQYSHPSMDAYRALHTFDEKLLFLMTPGNRLYDLFIKNCEECTQFCTLNDGLILHFEGIVGPKGGGSAEAQRLSLQSLLIYLDIKPTEELLFFLQDNLFGDTQTFYRGQIESWKTSFQEIHCRMFDTSFAGYNQRLH